jgi:hypothetical protein
MVKPDSKQPRFSNGKSGRAMTARKSKEITASKPKRTTAPRPKRTTARNIELYASAYRIAWKQISPLQKQEQPNIALRLHASIRRQIRKGATDPLLIATEAFKAVNEETPRPKRVKQVLPSAPVPNPPKAGGAY